MSPRQPRRDSRLVVLRRFGDASAPQMNLPSSYSWVSLAVLGFIAVVGFGSLGMRGVVEGYTRGAFIGLGIAITFPLALAAAAIIQFTVWSPVFRASEMLHSRYPSSVVVAARVPRTADEILGTSWPRLYTAVPWRVVVMVDEYGISLWNPTATESALVLFSWNDVEKVIAAEHVEHKLAVPGLALVAASGDVAFPLVLCRPGPAIATLIHGAELIETAATIESMRPQR